MKSLQLTAERRSDSGGRTAKKMRKTGKIPATVYGKKVTSQSVTVDSKTFRDVLQHAGNTGIVQISIADEKLPVLIHHVQRHPVTDEILHIEFHQINLKEKVKATIALVIEGVSPAVEEKTGVLLQVLQEIDIEALPEDLPEKISVDVSGLKAVNDEIPVSALSIPSTVKVYADPQQVVVRVSDLVKAEVEIKVQQPEEQPAAGSQEGSAPTGDTTTPSGQPEAEKKQ